MPTEPSALCEKFFKQLRINCSGNTGGISTTQTIRTITQASEENGTPSAQVTEITPQKVEGGMPTDPISHVASEICHNEKYLPLQTIATELTRTAGLMNLSHPNKATKDSGATLTEEEQEAHRIHSNATPYNFHEMDELLSALSAGMAASLSEILRQKHDPKDPNPPHQITTEQVRIAAMQAMNTIDIETLVDTGEFARRLEARRTAAATDMAEKT